MFKTDAHRKAEAEAAAYAERGMLAELSPYARGCAEEDFEAGYLTAAREYEAQLVHLQQKLAIALHAKGKQ